MKKLFLIVLLALAMFGCPKKKDGGEITSDIVVKDDSKGLLLTWVDEKGEFHTEQKVGDVPIVGRDAVRVVDPEKTEGTSADRVFVADLRQAKPDGTYPVKAMTRAEFEQIAVARREKHGPTLASASGSSSATPPVATNGDSVNDPNDKRGGVIIYGAAWCGPCHQAAAYLRRKGINFVEKDVEKDDGAQREMEQKLTRAGLRGGTIPVLDVRGKILVGFSERAVDDALGKAM